MIKPLLRTAGLPLLVLLAGCSEPSSGRAHVTRTRIQPLTPPTADVPPTPAASMVSVDPRGTFAGLDGRWHGSHNGIPLTMTLDGNRIELKVAGMDDRSGQYRIDATHAPAHFDVVWEGDELIGMILQRVDADHLRLENNVQGQPRPTSFGILAINLTRDGR